MENGFGITNEFTEQFKKASETAEGNNNAEQNSNNAEQNQQSQEQEQNQSAEQNSEHNQQSQENAEAQAAAAAASVENQNPWGEDFESKILQFSKEKYGKEVSSVEDLFKTPEPQIQEVDKYADVKPEVKSFLDFHKETGRDYNDFLALNTDWSAKSPLDLAKLKVSQELSDLGEQPTDELITAYIEKTIGVDISDPDDLDQVDLITLKSFAKDFVDAKNKEKEKYQTPLENHSPENNNEDPDMVTLENGVKMKKADYDAHVEKRNKYLDSLTAAANQLQSMSFNLKVDDKGVEKSIPFQYELSQEDRQAVLEFSSDVNAGILKLFSDGQGGLDHKAFAEAMFWVNPTNREKAISSMLQKAHGQATLDVLKEVDNANFTERNNLPGDEKNKGQRVVPIPGASSGFSVKHDFSNV